MASSKIPIVKYEIIFNSVVKILKSNKNNFITEKKDKASPLTLIILLRLIKPNIIQHNAVIPNTAVKSMLDSSKFNCTTRFCETRRIKYPDNMRG